MPHLSLLLVEDNPGDARLLAEMLAGAFEPPPEVVTAGALAQARSALAEHEFDCALADLTLPDADGLEVLDMMSADACTVPLVIVSGRSDEQFALRAVQSGAQDYLIKGRFDEHGLTRTIRHAIERKRIDHELSQLALYDGLTGLPNRALFLDRLGLALARARAGKTSVSVLHVDLDGYRAVNDRVGYEAGDAVLIEVSRRFRDAVPASDTVARIGGDSFAFVVELESEREVHLVSGRILGALEPPIVVGRDSVDLEASLGRAMARHTDEPEPLLQKAAVAMHIDKGRDSERRN
jgi:diguanylate cyclase (GGDEF)-like protein